MTPPNDLTIIKDVIRTFERASGACLNPYKFQALATEKWNTTDTGMGIEFQPYVMILGATFTSTKPLAGLIRAQAKLVYTRNLSSATRVIRTQLCWPEYGTWLRFPTIHY